MSGYSSMAAFRGIGGFLYCVEAFPVPLEFEAE